MCDNANLIEACKSGYYERVLNLLHNNYTVHVRDSKQATPLYHSCCHGHYNISSALIKYESDVNARVQWGSTALHAASDRGHIDCVKLLINSGADLSIQNERGDTALHLCAYRGYIDIVKQFILRKSNLFIKNKNEKTPADEAEGNNHKNTAELLRQNMIAVNKCYGSPSVQQSVIIPRTLHSSVHSQSSMSIPLTASQNGHNNFVRYSRDLTRFTRQTAPVPTTDLSNNPVIIQKRLLSHPIVIQGRQDVSHSGVENSQHNPKNEFRNGQMSTDTFQNGSSLNMLDNNKIPLRVQGREAMENFAETLQLQLVKKIEECDSKNKKIKELNDAILLQQEKLKTVSLTCVQLKEENVKLKQTGTSVQPKTKSKQETLDHQGILEALRIIQYRQQSWSCNEQSLQSLKDILKSRILTHAPPTSLDVPNKEWKVGKDFILLGDKPLNYSKDGDRDGSCSLVFAINHNRKEYVIKMMTNLINLQASQHGEGHSLDQFLIQNFGPEHNIPVTLPAHPNIITILHYYTGATDRFKKFINLLIPSKIDVPIEMANRTSFLVMDRYPQTLKSFMIEKRAEYPEPSYGLTTRFLLQLLYQILSAVHHLQKHGVVHRDIKADNVFLDNLLRPTLTDFGFARTLISIDGSPIMLTDRRHIFAGNNHAWAPELSRCSRNRTDFQENHETTTLQQIYSKADAYAVSRMFYSLLRPIDDGDVFPQSSVNRPHYEESDIPELPKCYPDGLHYILHNLVLDDPTQRMTERRTMLCTGMMLFHPKREEFRTESDVINYCHARILTLIATGDKISLQSTDQSLTMDESVETLSSVLESDFLFNITSSEFLEIYRFLKVKDLL